MLLLLAASTFAQQPKPKSEWKIDAPDSRCEYSEEAKACVYDLGDGFRAMRQKLSGHYFVIVGFSNQPPDAVSDPQLAIAVAAKVVTLAPLLKDAILKPKNDHEHLFRTATGRTAGVTIAADRKSAVVRIVGIDPDPVDF